MFLRIDTTAEGSSRCRCAAPTAEGITSPGPSACRCLVTVQAPHEAGVVSARSTRHHNFAGTTAISGIGATEFSKDSGRSELRLATEAVSSALADAGMAPSEVDGLVTFAADSNPEIEVARTLGMGELTFFSRIHYGGGAACATVHQAES